jgi:hypothetical protein
MTEEIDEPVDGEAQDVMWVDRGTLIAKIETDDGVYAETYEFAGGEKISGDE